MNTTQGRKPHKDFPWCLLLRLSSDDFVARNDVHFLGLILPIRKHLGAFARPLPGEYHWLHERGHSLLECRAGWRPKRRGRAFAAFAPMPIRLRSHDLAGGISVTSLRVRAFEAQERSALGNLQAAAANDESVIPPSRTVKGVVVDFEDNPVSGAIVVGGFIDTGTTNHRIFTTDSEGRFAWPIATDGKLAGLYAHKAGRALGFQTYWADPKNTRDNIDLKLGKAAAEPFAAVLVDVDGAPVAGARIWVEMLARNWETKLPDGRSRWGGTSYAYYKREVLGGSPLEPLLVTTTDEHGAFSFRALGPIRGSGSR